MQLTQTPVSKIDDLLDQFEVIKTRKKIEYYNVSCSIDIETSSFYNSNGDKQAIMYAFAIGINGKCIIGRTYEELIYYLNRISEHYQLFNGRRMIFYVHNLSFEFQFFRKWFKWDKVFALSERKVVQAIMDIGIELRCSYILSGYSLAKLGDNLTKHKVTKKVGDLDYSLIRHSKTPLTVNEQGYIINDVLVVMAYIQEEIEYYGDITKLQLTKTGYVRKYMKDMCHKDKGIYNRANKYRKYMQLMNSLTIQSVEEYLQLKRAFQGGFTHASSLYSGLTIKNVKSFDESSAYPYTMVSEQFPCNNGEVITIKNEVQLLQNLKAYCCMFDVTFYGLKERVIFEHPMSSSKCWNLSNYSVDNGRIINADKVSTTLTEQDFYIIEKFYKWDRMEIGRFTRYMKQYLPTDFVKGVLKLYGDKTTLKGVDGKEVEYMKSKENVNSCYGMCVTDICRDEIEYSNDTWTKELPDYEVLIEKYNKSMKRFLCYQWGVWVTAYARRNLFEAILELQEDYCYSDTDSVKGVNFDNHLGWFENYNNECMNKLKKACDYHKIDFELVKPKTIKGVEKPLGVWEFDGAYDCFKTLGAKRYMYVTNNKLNIVVSGVNKNNAVPYLYHTYKDHDTIFKHFDDGLQFPKEYECDGEMISATGKLTHTYIDIEQDGVVTDYLGVTHWYYERSSIHMEGCDFSLSLSHLYIDYLKGLREMR